VKVRGSIWRKWDLHVHTPASFSQAFTFANAGDRTKYADSIWDKYVDQLEKVLDVCAIGVTDYFGIEGYKKVLDYRSKGRLQNFQLVLPNIEFRLDRFVGKERLNYHVILSDEIDPEMIEKEFIEELHVKRPDGEPAKLTRKNIEDIGKELKKHQKSFQGKNDYVVGCENIVVNVDEVIDILRKKKSIFEGKYFLVLPEAGWCEIDWGGQDHLTRKELFVRSHAVFSSNQNTREWALGKKELSPEVFRSEFGSLHPCVHGSDAHSFANLCRPDGDRFCWIKTDPSFEGLKQIIYEPEERVRIQSSDPEYRKSIYTLSSVRIGNADINDQLSVDERSMPLNRNLVAVTGGKGSGKTALLDLVANCFEDRCSRSGVVKNSFVQRIEDEKEDLEIELEFAGQELEKFSKILTETSFFANSRITYLPQGAIEEYSGDREALNKRIGDIIFSNKDVMAKGYKERFDKIQDDIDRLAREIHELNATIFELEEETAPEIVSGLEGEKAIKEGQLKDKQSELETIEDTIEKGIKDKIVGLKEEETALRVKHSKLEEAKSDLEQLQLDLVEFGDTTTQRIQELCSRLSELSLSVEIPEVDFDPQFRAITRGIALVTPLGTELLKRIEETEEQLRQLSGVEKTHAELLQDIEDLKGEIQAKVEQLEDLNSKRSRAKSLEKDRNEKYWALLNKFQDWRTLYADAIGSFSAGKNEILSGIDFQSNIFFDRERFIELGTDILDQRSIARSDVSRYASELETIMAQFAQDTATRNNIESLLGRILSKEDILKRTRSREDFYKWIWGNYFSLSTGILFNNRPMDKLSIGQKGTVLLKLFLAEGDYPLIVDQPEENLDNKFIYDDLVGAFREAKKKRQVIIATNNANLIVNTDAEQIIVADFENNKISYKSGSLENLELRRDILPILEGGKEAFKKREEKYGIGAPRF
jgi:ABC-type lipoprotein export system ATPase subunit